MKKSLAIVALLFVVAGVGPGLSAQSTQPVVFNVTDYLNVYPDLMNVYGLDTDDVINHWTGAGLPAGYRGNLIFDAQYYLQNNPDVQAQFGPTNYVGAAQHFLQTGLPFEGRRGSLEFDVKYYLAHNSDLAAAFGATGYQQAADHFLNQGLRAEGRKGSADFDIKDYIGLYPDVMAAYGSTGYQQAFWHWLRRGKSGGRVGIGTPVVSPDCTSQQPPIIPNSNPPAVYSRIYIAYPFNLGGAGLRFNDSDITTADKFDSILRVYSGNPAATPAVAPQDHLVVCIGPGTFQTRGNYDFVINIKHTSNRGFAVGPYWKIHGFGTSATTLQLADFLENPPAPGLPPRTNTVLATVSDSSPGIEVSDLTIDDNFPILRQTATGMGMNLLNLQAVALRSDQGGHWIHNINVINAAGYVSEAFPFQIMSVNNSSPSQGNVIEYVTMSAWGGGSCTAIVMANAIGSVRFNVVDGYEKGFGGWSMGQVWMYDNFALNTSYGFNIDSLNNDGVNIWFNEIRHPLSYGIVVGSPGGQFSNFGIIYNTISIASDSVTGIVLGGNVTNSIVGRNNIIADGVSV